MEKNITCSIHAQLHIKVLTKHFINHIIKTSWQIINLLIKKFITCKNDPLTKFLFLK